MLVYFQKLCRNFQCNSILSCSAVSYFLSISSSIYLGISCCHPPLQLFLLLQEKCAHIFKNCLGKQRKRCKVVPQSTSAAPRDKLLSLPLQSASGQPHDTAQHEDRHTTGGRLLPDMRTTAEECSGAVSPRKVSEYCNMTPTLGVLNSEKILLHILLSLQCFQSCFLGKMVTKFSPIKLIFII